LRGSAKGGGWKHLGQVVIGTAVEESGFRNRGWSDEGLKMYREQDAVRHVAREFRRGLIKATGVRVPETGDCRV
jgi:hypothetical protein